MPSPASNALPDGVSVVTKGMHAGIQPRLLPPSQVAFAINCTFRNGLPRTRPAIRKVALNYSGDTETPATGALFQDAAFYQAVGQGESCLVAMIGGRMFRYLVGSSYKVDEITWDGEINDPTNPNAWMWQSEDFLISTNGAALPIFFDGAGARRSNGTTELPAGCMGVYVQGRNWMALPNAGNEPGNSFVAGDLVYSAGLDDGYGGRSAVLKFTENSFLSGGGAFAVPVQAGSITAMASVAIADTSLGQGPLQVMTQGSVFSVQTPILREDWATTQFPLMVVGLPNYGATGQNAVAAVNGDLWYRAIDGVRSYQVARRDFNTWVNTPLSVEVGPILDLDVERWLGKASCVLFNNRLLLTCAPRYARDRGVAWQGFIALDYNNISNLTMRSDPVYDGLWTGLDILKVVKGYFRGVERCFAFALDCDGAISLFEIFKDGAYLFDNDGDQDVGIECSLTTRSMGWRDGGNELKRLMCADNYLDRLGGPGTGTVEFEFAYRSDEDPTWRDWHSFSLCAPTKDCTTAGCPSFSPVREQFRTFLRIPEPSDVCSALTRRPTRTGYEFQARFWWKGFVQWNRIHFWSLPIKDSVITSCPTSETCQLALGCDEDWFTYSILDCNTPSPCRGMSGLVWEDQNTWIATENGGAIVRAEDQQPGCDGDADGGGDDDGGGGDTPTTPVPLPVWPVEDPYGCEGEETTGAISVDDPITEDRRFVGINPGDADPAVYLEQYGEPGCLQAWVTAVWNDFVAQEIPYSQARVEWAQAVLTGSNFMAQQVFPNQPGGYNQVVLLNTWLRVRYCPA